MLDARVKQVQLFAIDKGGFNKTITARMQDGALIVSSYAFDTEGYDRENDLTVAAKDIDALAQALGLRRSSGRQILKAVQQQFNSLAADSKFERFLKDSGIAMTGTGYTSFP